MKKINLTASLNNFSVINKEFMKSTAIICYAGDNRNHSSISKDAINHAIPSLDFIPVVAEFKGEDFGTHGGRLVIEDDSIKYEQTTKPYGVVIPNTARFQSLPDIRGEMVEYLVADCFLWYERYPELQVLREGELNNQSMEITVNDGFMRDDGYYEIKEFNFSALCILGKNVEGCFEEASMHTYTKNDFKNDYQLMINAFERYINSNKEVNQTMNEDDVIIEEQNMVKVDAQNNTLEENFNHNEKVVVESQEVVEEPVNYELIIKDCETKLNDKDSEISNLNTELSELKEKFSLLENEAKELREFKVSSETEKVKEEKETVFKEFSVGLTEEEIKPVRDEAENLTVSEIENKLNAIFSKKNLEKLKSESANFSKEPDAMITDIVRKEGSKSRYAV
jgi:hypothetical protein